MQPRTAHDLLPDLESGDVLLITPDVGQEYRATVLRIDHDRERARVRIPADPDAPGQPVPEQRRWFDRDELEAFDARGDVLVNPPDPGERPGRAVVVEDGGRYGPHERIRGARVARQRAGWWR